MVHGNRDYFSSIPLSTMYSMIDAGELAARLGSIVTFDRRGNVVWLDGFEEGIAQWERLGSGADWNVNISTVTAMSGGYSCQIKPHSAGSLYAGIERAHYALREGIIGFELCFCLGQYIANFNVYVIVYQNGLQLSYWVKYQQSDRAWYYLNSAGTYTKLFNSDDLATADMLWCRCKLVFDTKDKVYVRFLMNDKEYSMSGIACPVVEYEHRSLVLLGISVFGEAGHSPASYVDNIILTVNE